MKHAGARFSILSGALFVLLPTARADDPIECVGVTNQYGSVMSYGNWMSDYGQTFSNFGVDWTWSGKPALGPAVETDFWSAVELGKYWSDGAVPSGDKDYIVYGNKGRLLTCSTAAGSELVFNGRKLTVGKAKATDGRGSSSYMYDNNSGYIFAKTGRIVFANEGVDLVYGGFFGHPNGLDGSSINPVFSGKFNVLSPESIPFWIYDLYTVGTYTFDRESSFTGDETAGLQIKTSSGNLTTVKMLGDMSAYRGSVMLGKDCSLVFANDVNFPGTVKLTDAGAKLTVGDSSTLLAATIGSVDFAAAGTVSLATARIPADADGVTLLTIGSGITRADGVAKPALSYGSAAFYTELDYNTYGYGAYVNDNPMRTVTVVDVPASSCDAVSDMLDVAFSNGDVSGNKYSYATIVNCFANPYETVENGRRLLKADFPKVTSLKKNSDGNGLFNPATIGTYWYGREAGDSFSADTAYVCQSGYNGSFGDAALTFPGYAFSQTFSTLMRLNNDLDIRAYHLSSHAGIVCQCADKGRTRNTIRGKMHILMSPTQTYYESNGYYPSYPTRFCGDGTLEIAADISGEGVISLDNAYYGWGFTKAPFTLVLSGDNSAYKGRLYIGNASGYATELKASAANQFGLGTVAKDTYSAIKVFKAGKLTATDSFEIAEPSHGVYVTGGGKIGVDDGKQLTLGTQLTLGSGLVKEGAGTLALKGVHKFTADQLDVAANGEDVVTVSEGFVKGVAKEATDGLKYVFAANTGIRLSRPDTASADEQAYGFYNVNGSFDLTATGGKLRVTVDPIAKTEYPDGFSLKVCTVKENTLAAGDLAIKAPKGYRVASVTSATANGETTFTAQFELSGFALIIR